MTSRALNAQGRTVAAPTVSSADEALDLAYAWNRDEERAHMTVASVVVDGRSYPVATQPNLF
jgi:hypothetical protein